MTRRIFLIIAVSALAGTLAACISVDTTPEFLDASFSAEEVQKLTVLPPADLRIDRTVTIKDLSETALHAKNLNRERISGERVLTDLGYEVTFSIDDREIIEDALEEGRPEWISSLGSPTDRWVLVVGLQDLTTTVGYGASATARCRADLFDKQRGTRVWSHQQVCEVGLGGLIAMALDWSYDAVAYCSHDLLHHLPSRVDRSYVRPRCR